MIGEDLFTQLAKRKYSPNSIVFFPCLVSWTEQFPLAVQIIFQKKQLQELREFLKCRGAHKLWSIEKTG